MIRLYKESLSGHCPGKDSVPSKMKQATIFRSRACNTNAYCFRTIIIQYKLIMPILPGIYYCLDFNSGVGNDIEDIYLYSGWSGGGLPTYPGRIVQSLQSAHLHGGLSVGSWACGGKDWILVELLSGPTFKKYRNVSVEGLLLMEIMGV